MSPIQLEPAGHKNTIPDSSYQQARKNGEYAAQIQCDQFNAQLRAGFTLAWHDWAQTILDGRSTDTSNPPKPPKSFVISYFDDPTTGPGSLVNEGTVFQWPYPAQIGPPVAEAPPVPTVAPPQVQIHAAGNESVMNVPQGDTWPTGTILTAPDGGKWQKVSRPTPWGIAQLYQHIA